MARRPTGQGCDAVTMKARKPKQLLGWLASGLKGGRMRSQSIAPVVQSSRADGHRQRSEMLVMLGACCGTREAVDRALAWASNSDGVEVLSKDEKEALEPFWEWCRERGYLDAPQPKTSTEEVQWTTIPDMVRQRTRKLLT